MREGGGSGGRSKLANVVLIYSMKKGPSNSYNGWLWTADQRLFQEYDMCGASRTKTATTEHDAWWEME